MPSVYVKTLGCKVNTFDTHALENQFKAQGYDLLSASNQADVTVVNTCSVTASADREARYLARKFRRENPKTILVFTGCYAQTDSARLASMSEIDLVVPNEVKEQLVTLVASGLSQRQRGLTFAKLPSSVRPVSENRQGHFKTSLTYFDRVDSEQTRAFLKIQDGCNGFCTYCLIPYARGASRSVEPQRVMDEVKRLVDSGIREVVLTGIHIGDFGRDHRDQPHHQRPPIVDLLEGLFTINGLQRLRISSLEPSELSVPLIELLAQHQEVFCDHFHLPLQSGSDQILKRMRRTYDRKGYETAVHLVRHHFPMASISADVIPGFPGETEEDFRQTIDFVKHLNLSFLHVFPYSKRPNTAAARMPDHLPGHVVKKRAMDLRMLSKEQLRGYARNFFGREMDVLWEKDTDSSGRRLGHTPNYLSIAFGNGSSPLPGTITRVRVKGFVANEQLLGVPC